MKVGGKNQAREGDGLENLVFFVVKLKKQTGEFWKLLAIAIPGQSRSTDPDYEWKLVMEAYSVPL